MPGKWLFAKANCLAAFTEKTGQGRRETREIKARKSSRPLSENCGNFHGEISPQPIKTGISQLAQALRKTKAEQFMAVS
jgi:hypothetical protein